jgi:MFS family permease
MLVSARIAQALTAAATLPNVIALLRTHLPDVLRGKASGVIGGTAAIAAAIGPALGGVLTGAYGWRASFFVNVPLVAAGLFLFARIVAVDGRRPVRPRQAAISAWRGTLLDARLCGAATAAIALSNMSMYVMLLAIPVLLSGHGGDVTRSGLVLASLSVSTALSAPLGGPLADHRGRRLPALMGMITLAAGTTLVAAGQNSTPALVIGLLFSGVGLGLTGAGMQAAAMESVTRAAAGLAAGVSSTSRYIGSITGSLLWAAVFLASPRMGDVLWLSTAAAVLGVAAALAMRRR